MWQQRGIFCFRECLHATSRHAEQEKPRFLPKPSQEHAHVHMNADTRNDGMSRSRGQMEKAKSPARNKPWQHACDAISCIPEGTHGLQPCQQHPGSLACAQAHMAGILHYGHSVRGKVGSRSLLAMAHGQSQARCVPRAMARAQSLDPDACAVSIECRIRSKRHMRRRFWPHLERSGGVPALELSKAAAQPHPQALHGCVCQNPIGVCE